MRLAFALLTSSTPEPFHPRVPAVLRKRPLLTVSFAALALAATASTSGAQVFRGRVIVAAPVFAGGYYYSPSWLYDPWFGFGYQYPFGPYPYPLYRVVAPEAHVRLDVEPKTAEVFVDGYYAGIVDDFDGVFQRLHIAPGEHEIELYQQGYRTVRQRLHLTANSTFKVKYAMQPLAAGEQAEPPPQAPSPTPQAGPETAPAPYPPPRGPIGRRPPQGPPPPGPPPGPPPAPGAPRADASTYGSLSIRVQPADVEILIDGEMWRGPDAQDRLVVGVPEGPHTIEIRKEGYRTFLTQVPVHRGQTTPVNVSLRTQEER
jgi:hypothetical protein